jgi:hypothetical protein
MTANIFLITFITFTGFAAALALEGRKDDLEYRQRDIRL